MRVDEALVQDAEHDVDDEHGQDEQQCPGPAARSGTPARCPGTLVLIVGGQRFARRRRRPRSPRAPSETPGFRLKRDRHRRQLAGVVDRQRADVVARASRPRPAAPACRSWSGCTAWTARRVALVLRQQFHDDPVLVGRRVDREIWRCAVGVVERVLDLLRRDAERRGLVAVDVDFELRVLRSAGRW